MSFQPSFPGLFSAAPVRAPASEKQVAYARALAARTNDPLPEGIEKDRARLSSWIDAHKPRPSAFDAYPSSRQVGFAERIARLKRTSVPRECFRDRALMSRWIDSNKPR
ncbi:hypothetical protein [Sulfitobacter sp. S190]|uniref:hypothetical protein n=1 Tax=Sulfitobacter sp. S190 TaxID=2867022 RepID=UPI0021A3515B|nr:hypothetical protein [Sulfitobacter sp. S190]UWR21649.1 hypothetical protein K3756_13265 [Sulfitobacter sp. S190]